MTMPDPAETEPGQEPEPTNSEAELPDWARAQLKKARDEAAKYRTQVRELEPKARAHDDAEAANQTELEKLQKALAAEQSETAKLRRSVLVSEIAAEKGLTPAQAKRLSGETREALEADADELAELFKPGGETKAPPIPGKPTEQLPRGGGDPETEVEETDPAKLAALIPRG